MVLQTAQTVESAPRGLGRLEFIDFTRGLVMVLMAWDHTSNFWNQIHGEIEGLYPFRNPNLDLVWTLARFVTHYAAPTFVFLSGVSLALSVHKRLSRGDSQRDITIHIIIRGLLLLIFEALIVAPAFDLPRYYFGVIACIGVSLVIFSAYRRLPTMAILAISLIIILNQQWLDLNFIPFDAAWGHYLRRIVAEPGFTWRPYFALYPLVPWFGVMGLGWIFGAYLHGFDRAKLPRLKTPLTIAGAASIALFFVVRLMNGYGNLVRRWSMDILDWLYISKYPPSLAFLLWTLGGDVPLHGLRHLAPREELVRQEHRGGGPHPREGPPVLLPHPPLALQAQTPQGPRTDLPEPLADNGLVGGGAGDPLVRLQPVRDAQEEVPEVPPVYLR